MFAGEYVDPARTCIQFDELPVREKLLSVPLFAPVLLVTEVSPVFVPPALPWLSE